MIYVKVKYTFPKKIKLSYKHSEAQSKIWSFGTQTLVFTYTFRLHSTMYTLFYDSGNIEPFI